MSFNVIKDSIEQYFETAVSVYEGDAATLELLKCALLNPIRRSLTDQPFPSNLRVVHHLSESDPGWLRTAFNEGKAVYRFTPGQQMQDDICRVLDWILMAQKYNLEWLGNCDEQGRPKKLLKIGSMEQALQEAAKGMETISKLEENKTYHDLDGENTIMVFEDGYRIVELLTTRALDREGNMMNHCIGKGDYDTDLETGDCRFYSLRDLSNRAHVTMQTNTHDHSILNAKGNSDKVPVAKYIPYVQEFIKTQGYRNIAKLSETHLIEKDGVYYDAKDLPENFCFEGILNYNDIPLEKLPDGLHVTSALVIIRSPLRELPKNLRVDGALNAEYTLLEELPEGFQCGADINLYDSKLKKLPDNLTVEGKLRISFTDITELPRGLHVKGDLIVEGCNIAEFPDDLIVDGYIIKPRAGTDIKPSQDSFKLNELRELIDADKRRRAISSQPGPTFF